MAEVDEKQALRYVEYEGVAYRGKPGGWPMSEALVDGQWVKAGMAHNAAMYGRPIEESEAAEHGGEDSEGGSKA